VTVSPLDVTPLPLKPRVHLQELSNWELLQWDWTCDFTKENMASTLPESAQWVVSLAFIYWRTLKPELGGGNPPESAKHKTSCL
jgi:hypothetical protein